MESSPAEEVTLHFFHTKSYPLQKSIFWLLTVFWKVLAFLGNYPPKSEIIVSIKRTWCGELPWRSAYVQNFSHNKLRPSEKSNLRFFWPFVETSRIFSKTTLPSMSIWFQCVKRVVESSPAETVTPNFFTQKFMTFGKVKFTIFLTFFFKCVDFSRKLPSQIWRFGSNE